MTNLKKETEFNLSEKKIEMAHNIEGEAIEEWIFFKKEDVKEFIRLLKEKINNSRSIDLDDRYMVGIEAGLSRAWQIIDKLAGDKLI